MTKRTKNYVYILVTGVLLITISCVSSTRSGYEIWTSDQSNSVAGETARGVNGSLLWIWDSKDVHRQLRGGSVATAQPCNGGKTPAPCDLHALFPADLAEYDSSGNPTGVRLGDLPAFGRLHGMLPDPQNQYMNANIFAPGGGYVGIIDGDTKEAVALFRVTATNGTTTARSVHMSYWTADGSALLIANLHGKVLERIEVTRNSRGNITQLSFNQSASLGVGKAMTVNESAKVFLGANGAGNPLIGEVVGAYDLAVGFADLTPSGVCKENGCNGPAAANGGRANNVIICPIVSNSNHAYITFGGGGLLVADTESTPMHIVGEYGNEIINGAGCGGVQVDNHLWLNAGVSAAAAGATQSTFTIYSLANDGFPKAPNFNAENQPAAKLVFKDSGNTATIGNLSGTLSNNSGQAPQLTTRRDAHGMTSTHDGSHVHTVDRIQNTVEVFDTSTLKHTRYDLTSADGQGNGVGPCATASVADDIGLPNNDPAPDLMDTTPDGRYMVVALRGPIPVSVTHAAQGSCPGVGIIQISDTGDSGKLVGVLRTTNTLDTAPQSAPGGYAYTGAEHSDVHGVAIRLKSGHAR